MTTASSMLDAHPALPDVDTQVHGDTIDLLSEAARTARLCADACLHEQHDGLRDCIVACWDVADLADATAHVIVRVADRGVALAALAACRAALRACAEHCRGHGGHLRHCAICAQVCDRAEEQCVQMEAALLRHAATVRPRVPDATAVGGAGRGGAVVDPGLDITAPTSTGQPIHLGVGGDLGDGAD